MSPRPANVETAPEELEAAADGELEAAAPEELAAKPDAMEILPMSGSEVLEVVSISSSLSPGPAAAAHDRVMFKRWVPPDTEPTMMM